MRTFSRYYFFIFLGFILYKFYYETGKEAVILKLVVKFGLFISIINFSHFLLLITDHVVVQDYNITFDRYNLVVDYVRRLNTFLADYIVVGYHYDGILRPLGYFYDTHSQYYLPLGSLVILLFGKIDIKFRKSIFALMLMSVLVSGIKTAYVTIIILTLVYFLTAIQNRSFLKYFLISFIVAVAIYFILNKYFILIFGGTQLYKILFQLWGHFIQIPLKLFSYEPSVFLLGGEPFLRSQPFFYSEVFFITASFSIGFVGVFLYLIPAVILKNLKTNKLPAYIFLAFLLSLSHYSVYMVGINILFSALSFMYLFVFLNGRKAEETL
jgi:hypothetical protein